MDRLAFNSMAAINEYRLVRQNTMNELANVSTPGFKRSLEMAVTPIEVSGAGFTTRVQPKAEMTDRIQLDPGPVMVTGRPLDISMSDKTVLGVTGRDGQLAFTRRGDLRVSPNGVLETGAGHAVRGEGGEALNVPAGSEIQIASDGSVFARNPAQPNAAAVAVGRLLLRDASQATLRRREDGLFSVDGRAGRDITNGTRPVGVTGGALEGSAVNAMEMMVSLMDQSRSFEQQIRIIKEIKSGDEAGASMMKLNP